jgi:PhnB protein
MIEPTIYLFFKGNCLEAMTHYANTLGGSIHDVFRNGDAPDPQSRMPGGDELVMNLAMRIGKSVVMASDCPENMYEPPQGFRITLAAPSLAEFDRLHAALAREATSVAMPPGETFWAERFAMFNDRYGTPWMLMFEGNKQPGR